MATFSENPKKRIKIESSDIATHQSNNVSPNKPNIGQIATFPDANPKKRVKTEPQDIAIHQLYNVSPIALVYVARRS